MRNMYHMGTQGSHAFVVWGSVLPVAEIKARKVDVVIASKLHETTIRTLGCAFLDIEDLVAAGSIYEASSLVEELPKMTLSDGTVISKAVTYKGFELWWTHYNGLFISLCLPYTQYKSLLSHLKEYKSVTLFNAPHRDLFTLYFRAHQYKEVTFCGVKKSPIRFGVCLQILFTCISLPFILLMRRSVLLNTSDKMDVVHDHDPRLSMIYSELRRRRLPFVEYIRSVEPWRNVLSHAVRRRRPVIYSEAIVAFSALLYKLSGKRALIKRFDADDLIFDGDPEQTFKRLLSVQCLRAAHADMLTIRTMEIILKMIGTKAYLAISAGERNFPSVLAAKTCGIPTMGILHGFASRYYNHYDFMHGYAGEKRLTLDVYGVWSDWWKEYYERYSDAYQSEQLIVSGPMRSMQGRSEGNPRREENESIRVLFVSEIVAVPSEVVPYLDTLLDASEFAVYIKFRSQGDSFEAWLEENRPDILKRLKGRILKGSMDEAIAICDVTVGSQSTGVIEAVLQGKSFVFFNTKKWGDYYDLKQIDTQYHFFAENPQELITYIKESRSIPANFIENFRIKFFGDSHKNGSVWVVDQVAQILSRDK